jgi:hypothetical protein
VSSHNKAPEVYDGVSTSDVPSAGFGWSRTPRTGTQIAGWVTVLILLGYNFGNHTGHVETIWLFTLAALVAIGLLIHAFQPKLSQVRTLTGHNKPEGHVEPDWNYNQKTLSGDYSSLSDAELRAINIDPALVEHLREKPASKQAFES